MACAALTPQVLRVKEQSLPPFWTTRVRDPELLADAIHAARFDPCQLSHRHAPSALSRLSCPSVWLDMVELGPAMLFTGALSKDHFTLIFVSACPGGGHAMNFSTEHTDNYIGFYPPGGLLDARTPAGYANATLTVPIAAFHAAAARYFPEIPESMLAQGAAMRVGRDEQRNLRALLAMVHRALTDPAQPLASVVLRRETERQLLAAFFRALRSGAEDLVPPAGERTAARHRRLRQARDLIAERLHEPMYLDDLCGAVNLSRRGVENLFMDLLGISPTTYLRHQRLHGVRRALQHATPKSGAVKQAALEWGFWHLGHFARDYGKLFGESPSATLQRR